MKTIRSLILSLAALLTGLSGYAQQNPSGLLMTAYSFSPADMLLYSNLGYTFGMARSSAMGGAFTSLGGDLASIGINPAGIGMYRSSVWGFSPSLTISDTRGKFSRGHDTAHTRFAFNNIGTVLCLAENSRGLIGFNMGLSYNKAADFNYRSGTTLPAGDKSLMHIFQAQLNNHGILKMALDGDPFGNLNIGLEEWGSVLSYLTGAISPVDSGDPYNNLYNVGSIGTNTLITPSLAYDSRGSVGEYNISGGFNINNILYIGFGVTIQDIFHEQEIDYSEEYSDDGINGNPHYYLKSMNYRQTNTVSGSGVNFKLGVIVRPVSGLRLGIAVHTPTAVDVTHEYIAEMQTEFWGLNNVYEDVSPLNTWDYSYTSPTRLMAGISYTLGNFAAISADYEKVFYNGMRLGGDDSRKRREYRAHIRDTYKAADNIRGGIEIKPIPMLAVRAGYSFYGSPYKKTDSISRYTPIESRHISAGLGFRLNRNTTLDVAYIYSKTNYADVTLYSYQGKAYMPDNNGGYYEDDLNITPDPIRSIDQTRHTLTMSFNFLF